MSERIKAGKTKISTGIDEGAQSSNFMNATLHSGPPGIAVSIAVSGNYPEHVKTESDVKQYLETHFAPLVEAGFDVFVQIGQED
jgi:hypothetical protein